jgi:hypothetical protein
MNMHQTTDSAEAPNEQQASANAAVALEFAAGHIPVFPCWEKDAVDGNGKPILNKQGKRRCCTGLGWSDNRALCQQSGFP